MERGWNLQVSAEEDESHALLAADAASLTAEDAAAVDDTMDGWEASDSVCSRTLHALRSLVLTADGASQDMQQELTRSAAHAVLRLDAARCKFCSAYTVLEMQCRVCLHTDRHHVT